MFPLSALGGMLQARQIGVRPAWASGPMAIDGPGQVQQAGGQSGGAGWGPVPEQQQQQVQQLQQQAGQMGGGWASPGGYAGGWGPMLQQAAQYGLRGPAFGGWGGGLGGLAPFAQQFLQRGRGDTPGAWQQLGRSMWDRARQNPGDVLPPGALGGAPPAWAPGAYSQVGNVQEQGFYQDPSGWKRDVFGRWHAPSPEDFQAQT